MNKDHKDKNKRISFLQSYNLKRRQVYVKRCPGNCDVSSASNRSFSATVNQFFQSPTSPATQRKRK